VVSYQSSRSSKVKDCFQELASQLHERGVTQIVVLLTQEEMDFYYGGTLFSMYETFGFRVKHYPIQDHHAPRSMKSFIELQVELVEFTKTEPILIHCLGGIGRTGLVAAGLIVALGSTALKAMKVIRKKTPGSIETAAQEQFLLDYATFIHN